MIDLRYRHVEAFAETVFESLDDVPLLLQGMGVFNVEFRGLERR